MKKIRNLPLPPLHTRTFHCQEIRLPSAVRSREKVPPIPRRDGFDAKTSRRVNFRLLQVRSLVEYLLQGTLRDG